jgi:DNA-binding response OmpR family regulator
MPYMRLSASVNVNNADDTLIIAATWTAGIIFSDVGLPDMDGFELAQRLLTLQSTSTVTLIAIIVYGQSEDKVRAREACFDRHVVKPVQLASVMDSVTTHANNKSDTAGPRL